MPTPQGKFTLKQDEKKTQAEHLLLPPSLACPLPSSELDTCPPALPGMPVTALLLPASSWGVGEAAYPRMLAPMPVLGAPITWDEGGRNDRVKVPSVTFSTLEIMDLGWLARGICLIDPFRSYLVRNPRIPLPRTAAHRVTLNT